MSDDDLSDFEQTDFTHDGKTRTVYRKGTGPGVIVIHEIPGITPTVIAFAEEVVAAGFTVVMPQLFGRPETPSNGGTVASAFIQVCTAWSSPSWPPA